MRVPFLVFLLVFSLCFAGSIITEGGNVSYVDLNGTDLTSYWAGIVGWMDPLAPTNPSNPISNQTVGLVDIYLNYPNGTYYNATMIVVRDRVNQIPSLAQLSSPTAADFSSTGFFNNFTAFNGLNFSTFSDSPLNTFANPLVTAPCTLASATYSCAYIHLVNHSFLGILKYSNGTHEEPVFVTTISSTLGYNGTYFDFQYMVPRSEGYFFYVYPTGTIPEVIIHSPQPTTYNTSYIPLIYTINSHYAIASCWYILDGHTVHMPDCTSQYLLVVGGGAHHLSLYAEDVLGQVGSDSVTFQVQKPPPNPSGPGSPHVPQPPKEEEEVPPLIPPTYELFGISPEEINILINYPLPGEADFTLYSATPLEEVTCFINADFAEYTTVELNSTEIPSNSTISGRIIVEMPPTEILDYNGDYQGIIQCVGKNKGGPSLMLSTAADIYLEINKPWIAIEEETLAMLPGEQQFFSIDLTNAGPGTAYTYALTLQLEGPQADLFVIMSTPTQIYPGETKEALIFVSVPYGYEPGTYLVPLAVYENGRHIGGRDITLIVAEEGEFPAACKFPIFINTFVFRDLLIPWLFLIVMFLINWALQQWKRRSKAQKEAIKALDHKQRRIREIKLQARLCLIALAPLLLALLDVGVCNPCFMMNVVLLEFFTILFWDLRKSHDKRRW